MFPVRLHKVSNLDSINRRLILEEFAHWGRQLNEVGDYSIALATLTLGKFSNDAFCDFWWNRASTFDVGPHDTADESRVQQSVVDIDTTPGGVFTIDWSANFIANSNTLSGTTIWAGFIRVVPYVGNKIVWGAADKLEGEYSFTIDGQGEPHSLSGSGTFSLNSGRFEVGLLCLTSSYFWDYEFTNFTASNVQVLIERVHQ